MANYFIGKGNLADSPKGRNVDRKDNKGTFYVASMRVFFDRYERRENGELEQAGGFWREVEIYGDKAENAVKLLRKGARVLVVGSEMDYLGTDDNGAKVQVIKIVAEDVALVLTRVESVTFAPRAERNTSEEALAA